MGNEATVERTTRESPGVEISNASFYQDEGDERPVAAPLAPEDEQPQHAAGVVQTLSERTFLVSGWRPGAPEGCPGPSLVVKSVMGGADRCEEVKKVLDLVSKIDGVPDRVPSPEPWPPRLPPLDDKSLIVTTHISGIDLYTLVDSGDLAKICSVKTMFRRITRLVSDIHEVGVVHRDIKLDNIIVADNGQPFLIDWEFATILTNREYLASGSMYYAAPELFISSLSGDHPEVGYCNDVWSLGIVLYCMLFKKFPYPLISVQNDDQLFKYMAWVRNEWGLGRYDAYKFSLPPPRPTFITGDGTGGGGGWGLEAHTRLGEDQREKAQDLLSKILCPPSKRLTARQMLDHPYLANALTIDL